MTDDNQDAPPVQVGDSVPSWILDDDGNLVAVTMARVTGISDNGDVELDYPTERASDAQPDEGVDNTTL